MTRLTEAMVRDAKAPINGRITLLDSDSGVRLRITPTGAKSWIVLRRIKGGKPVLITLGKHPALSLATARKLARKTIEEMASGADPRNRIKAEGVAAMTVAEALEGYLTLRCSQLKPSTSASYRAAMRSELKPIADQPIKTLTSEMVIKWHKGFASRSNADRAARLLRTLLRYANDRHGLCAPDGKIATDALRTLRLWTPLRRRTRMVADMAAWQAAIERCPTAVRDLFFCLAATGLRRDELRCAKWSQIDLERCTLFLPDPKNRQPTLLPLPSQVVTVLRLRRAADTKADLAFSNDGVTPLAPKVLSRWLARTSAEMGARWSPHDLRRGYLSVAASFAPAYVVKRLAHHMTPAGDVTGGYVVLGIEELRPWAQKTADKVLLSSPKIVPITLVKASE
jgi:integrase